jgi:hypothetical protein
MIGEADLHRCVGPGPPPDHQAESVGAVMSGAGARSLGRSTPTRTLLTARLRDVPQCMLAVSDQAAGPVSRD